MTQSSRPPLISMRIRKAVSLALIASLFYAQTGLAVAVSDYMKSDRDRSGYLSPQQMQAKEAAQLKNLQSLSIGRTQKKPNVAGPFHRPNQNLQAMKEIQAEIARTRQHAQRAAKTNERQAGMEARKPGMSADELAQIKVRENTGKIADEAARVRDSKDDTLQRGIPEHEDLDQPVDPNVPNPAKVDHYTVTDPNGNVREGSAYRIYGIVAGKYRLIRFEDQSTTVGADGSRMNSLLIAKYGYAADGAPNGIQATENSALDDGYGNLKTSLITFGFSTLNGKVLLTSAQARSESRRQDGSRGTESQSISYSYDREGRMTGASGSVSSQESDSFGNATNTASRQSFVSINGKLKLERTETESKSSQIDGSGTTQLLTTTQSYDRNGALISKNAQGSFSTTDGTGGRQAGTIRQEFAIAGGQARVSSLQVQSITFSIDGSGRSDQTRIAYVYDARGRLIGMSGEGSFRERDAKGNLKAGVSSIRYEIAAGRARVASVASKVEEANADGSIVRIAHNLHNVYDAAGRLTEAFSQGTLEERDAQGETAHGSFTGKYAVIAGQPKLSELKIVRETQSIDGDRRSQFSEFRLSYDSNGRLAGASGWEGMTAQDAYGNVERQSIAHQYGIVQGRALRNRTLMVTERSMVDERQTREEKSIAYYYDPATLRLIGASASGSFEEKDEWGTRTTGKLLESYSVAGGRLHLGWRQVSSTIERLDGSRRDEVIETRITRDSSGRLTGMSDLGKFTEDDGGGNVTHGTLRQGYVFIAGMLLVADTEAQSATRFIDGSVRDERLYLAYRYDSRGAFIGGSGGSKFRIGSRTGAVHSGEFTHELAPMGRSIRLVASSGKTQIASPDGALRTDLFTAKLQYNARGNLTSIAGSGQFESTDAYGNKTSGSYIPSFIALRDQPKLSRLEVSAATRGVDGSATSESSTVNFSYDAVSTRLVSATEQGRSIENDGLGRVTVATWSGDYAASGEFLAFKSGQSRILSRDADGSELTIEARRTHQLDAQMNVVSVAETGVFMERDSAGQTSKGTFTQRHAMVNGQPRLTGSDVKTERAFADGSYMLESVSIQYAYDAAGRLIAASGSGVYSLKRSDGSVQNGMVLQSYQVIGGKVYLTGVIYKAAPEPRTILSPQPLPALNRVVAPLLPAMR